MPNVNSVFPSKWVQASDLNGDTPVIISDVGIEAVGQPPEQLPVIHFHNSDKGLVLNKTNARTIAGHHGDEMDAWVGRQIVLYPTVTEFSGRTVPCIRVRSVIENANKAVAQAQQPINEANPPSATEYAGPDDPPDADPLASDAVPF